jgi:uncharacterized protein
MDNRNPTRCTAFAGFRRLASGELPQVAVKTKEALDQGEASLIRIFDDITGERIELDFRGTAEEVLRRLGERSGGDTSAALSSQMPRGPGRPKLGVVAREVTLLPRHWDWLNRQPGGASVALRRLVEEARRVNADRDRVRQSQEAAYRVMSEMAGDLPGFEEAARALFAGNRAHGEADTESWPTDTRDYLNGLAADAIHGEMAGR